MCATAGAMARTCDAAPFLVLAVEDEGPQRCAVHPVRAPQDGERRQHPPRVADVRQLLRAAVEAAGRHLALRQPPAEQVRVHVLQTAPQGEGGDARENLPRVRLGPRHAAEAAVEVAAARDVGHRGGRCRHLMGPTR